MPGLLTLKTDLKSLKYGQDRPGGGDSGQPYIKTDINTVDSGFNRLRLTKFDDGLVRGGIIGTLNASVVDTLRIGKFLTDFPKGPLFIVKQVGLQLSNPRLESKQVNTDRATRGGGFLNNSLNFIANIAGKIENAVGPTRIYNLGINTLAQIPINAIGGHVVRHGFLPIRDESKDYINVVQHNNIEGTNRLERLSKKLYLGPEGRNNKSKFNLFSSILNVVNPIAGIGALAIDSQNQQVINSYIGGPGSVYGLISTTIRRSDYTNDQKKINDAIAHSRELAGFTRDDKNQSSVVKIKDTKDFAISNITGSSFVSSSFKLSSTQLDSSFIYNVASDKDKQHVRDSSLPKIENINDLVPQGPSSYPSSSGVTGLNSLSLPNLVYGAGSGSSTYDDVTKAIKSITTFDKNLANNIGIYATITSTNTSSLSPTNGILPNVTDKPVYKNTYNEKVTLGIPWNKVSREIRVGSGRKDRINYTGIFRESSYYGGDGYLDSLRDLVKFRIQAVNTDNPGSGQWMVFRAYITDLSDDTTPEWSDVKYAGRGDKFYIYNGFTRKINIGFKVAALSEGEMMYIYRKLNFLMSNTMPDYSGVLMRGPLVRMTVGNWIDSQLGKLDSVNIKVPQDSPWEIALDEPEGGKKKLILPHVLDVSLAFTPIGSDTAARNLISKKSTTTSHIAQNNTGDIGFQYIR